MKPYNLKTLVVGTAVALLIGAILSYFAWPWPDGLEKVQEDLGMGEPAYPEVPSPPSAFDEYGLRGVANPFLSNAIAGTVGTLLVLGLLLGVGYVLKGRMGPGSPEKPT